MGKLTISMAIFNSYVKLPEGNIPVGHPCGTWDMALAQPPGLTKEATLATARFFGGFGVPPATRKPPYYRASAVTLKGYSNRLD